MVPSILVLQMYRKILYLQAVFLQFASRAGFLITFVAHFQHKICPSDLRYFYAHPFPSDKKIFDKFLKNRIFADEKSKAPIENLSQNVQQQRQQASF
jgi:hypothetical protein